VCFSLVSVTTTGYGDLAAATDLGRLPATSEAVLGAPDRAGRDVTR
jgi:hypothetical protein